MKLVEVFNEKNFKIGQVELLMKHFYETADVVGYLATKETEEFYRGQEYLYRDMGNKCKEWLDDKRNVERVKE